MTLEVVDSDGKLLEQLGLDDSSSYLGTNISIIGADYAWTDRIDQNPLTGESGNFGAEGSEPSIVGTNITLKIVSSEEQKTTAQNQASPELDNSLAVGTNMTLELVDSEGNSWLDQLDPEILAGDQPLLIGTNTTVKPDSSTEIDNPNLGTNITLEAAEGEDNSWMERSEQDSLTGGEFGVNNAPNNDSDYQWQFSGGFDQISNDGGGDSINLDHLFEQSPWGDLKAVGIGSFEDVFPNMPNDLESNPFASGTGDSGDLMSNPFAGGMAS